MWVFLFHHIKLWPVFLLMCCLTRLFFSSQLYQKRPIFLQSNKEIIQYKCFPFLVSLEFGSVQSSVQQLEPTEVEFRFFFLLFLCTSLGGHNKNGYVDFQHQMFSWFLLSTLNTLQHVSVLRQPPPQIKHPLSKKTKQTKKKFAYQYEYKVLHIH